MDLRTQTSLIAAVLSFAIASTVLMRARRRRVHWYFALFGASVGAWYLSTFLVGFLGGGALWQRLNLVCAVVFPLSAVQFFQTFVEPESKRITLLQRMSLVLALGMTAAIFTPFFRVRLFAALIFMYVFVLLGAAIVMLFRAARSAPSRFERARLIYLVVVLALAAVFTLAEYLPYAGLDIPPVGAILLLVFLYVLSQSILRYRLLDLYELAGRLTLLTALSFSLAGILWVLVFLVPGHFFLHSVVAALVLFLIFDPLRAKLEQQIAQFFYRERSDLERLVGEVRAQLAHTLSIDDMTQLLMSALLGSRRLTDASIYLVDERGNGFDLSAHIGREPIARMELAQNGPLVDRLRRGEELVLENLQREIEAARELGEEREVQLLNEVVATLFKLHAAVVVGLRGKDEIYGLLCVRDDRMRDAYSPEEVQLLQGLAAQASIAVENSRLYQQLRQRDRLAELGGMAAGLAHEIRNPLGAIKASAQFLAEPGEESQGTEFLDIIVEETDRLNRVVSSFLDYARPNPGDASPIDINATLQRSMTLLGPDLGEVDVQLELAENLPLVRVDPERLRQVLINLGRNAAQAMEGQGELTVRTSQRTRRELAGELQKWVEISVSDTGPGIPQKIRANLFVPFVTTKDRGTGLGLAISQRIIISAGGHIEVRSQVGIGSTFVVRLPAVEEGDLSAKIVLASVASQSQPLQSVSSPPTGASSESGLIPSKGEGSEDPDLIPGEEPASLATNR